MLVELGLFLLGMLATGLVLSSIALPVLYGLPRALWWAASGLLKARVVLLYLVSPLLWSFALVMVFLLLALLAPQAYMYLRDSDGFSFGQSAGTVLLFGRILLSRSARRDLTMDFLTFVRPSLTPPGMIRAQHLAAQIGTVPDN